MKKKTKQYISKFMAMVIGLSVLTQIPMFNQIVHAETSSNTDNLEVNKTATYNQEDGSYTINLEAYTTGDVEVITKSKPTDIVLVLDQSGSMSDTMQFNEYYEKVYSFGAEGENIDSSKTYYIIDPVSKEYKPITRSTEKAYYFLNGTLMVVYAWKSGDNLYLPANKAGLGEVNDWTAIQFYEQHKEPKGPTKLDSLKAAADAFVKSVEADSKEHRIAVVGFASGEQVEGNEIAYFNTDLFIGSSKFQYNTISSNNYKNAFQLVETNSQNIHNSIAALTASGATRADLGMNMANNIFKNTTYDESESRNKVVVMFTDGEPTNTNTFDTTVASKTIAESLSLKQSGVSVYTVGVVDTLDNTQDPASAATNDLNRYMQYVSSNYPNAVNMSNGGAEGNHKAGKFLAATDDASLKEIFTKISEEISSTTSTLNEKTVLKDYISDYFEITSQQDIEVYTQQYLGDGNWAEKTLFKTAKLVYDPATKSVSVSNFNYKENYIVDGENPKGAKLVVELKVKPKSTFIGGNSVDTNLSTSGIYDTDTLVKKFPMPKVDVAINFKETAKDSSIYLTNHLENPEDIIDANAETAGLQVLIKEDLEAALDGINNRYVDIQYTFKDESGNVIGIAQVEAGTSNATWTKVIETKDITDDLLMNVEVSVTPNGTASNVGEKVTKYVGNASSTIYVFKPQLTVENTEIFLKETVDVTKLIKSSSWFASRTTAPTPKGLEPSLSYKYYVEGTEIKNVTAYQPLKDSDVTLGVIANNLDITKNTTIVNKNKPTRADAHIQVLTGELKITKKIDAAYSDDKDINANQTFIFKIEEKDATTQQVVNTYYQTINFGYNDAKNNVTEKSVVMKGLGQGEYVVTEEIDWSWKYELTASETNYKDSPNSLMIGEKNAATEAYPYFGIEEGTTINTKNVGNPGTITITNTKNTVTSVIGDCASAINQFMIK